MKGTKVIEEDELAKRQKKWRPEPIEGWTKKACLPMVRAERIDRLVYAHQKAGGNRYQPLPWHGKKRGKGLNRKDRPGVIPNRVAIVQHPKRVDRKIRFGDLESDLMVGN